MVADPVVQLKKKKSPAAAAFGLGLSVMKVAHVLEHMNS